MTKFYKEWCWPHFEPKEVLSPTAMHQLTKRGILLLQPEALDLLEALRNRIQAPIIVNYGENKCRGYRSALENNVVGGALFSRHVQGIAFDITCKGIPPDSMATHAKRVGWRYALPYPDENFCHIDLGVRGF